MRELSRIKISFYNIYKDDLEFAFFICANFLLFSLTKQKTG